MPSFDVIVVGGGIIGGSIALRLAQENLSVAVFDRQQPGREASWAAAGILSPAPDSPHAIPLVPLAKASLALYPQFVADVEDLSRCSVGYRPTGTIEVMFSATAERELSTLVALHHGLGLPTEPLPLDDAHAIEPALSRHVRAAALLPYEACLDPRALAEAVFAAARAAGAEIRSGAEVTQLLTDAGRCVGVLAAGEKFSAGNVVLAAGAFSAALSGLPRPVPARPVRGQMVALRAAEVELHGVIRCDRGYILPRGESPQRIVAGSTLEDAGFVKRVTPAGMERVFSMAQELAPALAGAEIVETWSGLRPDSPDHLPILGPSELPGLIVATGHYRNGIVLAPATAQLVREWITLGRTSVDCEAFSPLRFAARSGSAVPSERSREGAAK